MPSGEKQSVFAKIKAALMRALKDYEMLMGEVLTEKGLITGAQLKEALKLQSDQFLRHKDGVGAGSEPLGVIIVRLGFAKEQDVLNAIREHYGIQVESLRDDIAGMVRRKRQEAKTALENHTATGEKA